MGITEKILLVLFAVFALLAVLRLFAAPLKLAGKLLVNTLLGFALLGILSALGVLAKLSLGLNLFNALIIAVLGVPGLALLILLRLVFISCTSTQSLAEFRACRHEKILIVFCRDMCVAKNTLREACVELAAFRGQPRHKAQ